MADSTPSPVDGHLIGVARAVDEAVVAFATRRDLIEVAGPDAGEYLHGQLSQDVNGVPVGGSTMTLLLQPRGKIDAWMRLSRPGHDRFWLDVDRGFGDAALARLQRFKLRVDCELNRRAVDVVAVRGAQAGQGPMALGFDLGEEDVVVDAHWPGVSGFDVLGSGVQIPGAMIEGTEGDLEALRISLGVPAMGAELDESTIPAAAGIVESSVDFTKGCYVGQELVARIDSRGANTPTRLCRVRFGQVVGGGGIGTDEPSPGAAVVVADQEVGTLTSYASSSGMGPVGLAYVKRGVEVPGSAMLAVAGGELVPIELVELALSDATKN